MDGFNNALMGYMHTDPSTSDLYNMPIRKGGFLPFTEYLNRTEFDPSAGILGSIGSAVTAPGRAWNGEISDEQMLSEGANFAGLMGFGEFAGAAAPSRNAMMSAYKRLGPKDAPANLETMRRHGMDGYLVNNEWTPFDTIPAARWDNTFGRMSPESVQYTADAMQGKHPGFGPGDVQFSGEVVPYPNDLNPMSAYDRAWVRWKNNEGPIY